MELERNIRIEPKAPPTPDGGAPLSTLVRRLADETSELFRQEVGLARLELKQTLSSMTSDAIKIGIGIGLAAVGGLALTTFLVLIIGNLLGGAYWAGALIVGGVFLIVGGIIAAAAAKGLKRLDVKPDETIQTLKEDKRWAAGEAKDFKRDVLSS